MSPESDGMEYVRHSMVADLQRKGILSESLLKVMLKIPRHLFISEALRYGAYDDVSLPLGFGQTISKPSIIAMMVQALNLTGRERVLEIGSGSGYQSAIIAELSKSLVTIERIKELYRRARDILFNLNYSNVKAVHTDDFNSVQGEFDAIIMSAGAESLPAGLVEKLVIGGKLVLPVGNGSAHQIKRIIRDSETSFIEDSIGKAKFVPHITSQ
ncbi:protein-L-isoaspartate(D-aspartate) O-methyltransferase [Spirochaetota bacterium]